MKEKEDIIYNRLGYPSRRHETAAPAVKTTKQKEEEEEEEY
jgi:hypothetical protein